MIQAMVWALVFTSGAGMSRSGPMSGLISVAKRRQNSGSTSGAMIKRARTIAKPIQ